MIIRRRVSSSSGVRWLRRAQSLARSLAGRDASKREVTDGFLVEAKKVGDLRSASVIEIPSTLVMKSHYSDSSVDRQLRNHAVISRDPFNPKLPNSSAALSEPESPSFYTVYFGTEPSGELSVLSSGALSVVSAHESYHCTIQQNSAGKHWLNIASTPRKGEAIGWNYYFSEAVLKGMFPSLGFDYLTDDNNQRLFQPLAIRVDSDDGDNVVRKLVILMAMPEIEEFDWPNGVPYSIARHHLTLIELDIDQLTYSGVILPIDTFLPSWAVPTILKRPIGRFGLVEFPADSSIRLTSAMLDASGSIVASFNYFVRVQTYYGGVVSETEMNLARLGAAGRIVISGQTIEELDLFDVDVYAWNGSSLDFFPVEPEVSRTLTRPLISVGLTADGSVVTNGMVMDRRVRDVFLEPYLEPKEPYSYLAINGEVVAAHADGVGALNTKDVSHISHLSYSSVVACSVSCVALSEKTTAMTWFEPQLDREEDQGYGVMFTDGVRVKHIALGRTSRTLAGQDVQLSCPQKEVRSDEGVLLCPSTILASYWDNGVYLSIRKGPIWEEDGADEDEASYWSEPTPIDADDVPYPYFSGSPYMTGLHGYYFAKQKK